MMYSLHASAETSLGCLTFAGKSSQNVGIEKQERQKRKVLENVSVIFSVFFFRLLPAKKKLSFIEMFYLLNY